MRGAKRRCALFVGLGSEAADVAALLRARLWSASDLALERTQVNGGTCGPKHGLDIAITITKESWVLA